MSWSHKYNLESNYSLATISNQKVAATVDPALYVPAVRAGLVSAQVTAFPTVDLHVLGVAFVPVPAVSHIRPQIAITASVHAVAYHRTI